MHNCPCCADLLLPHIRNHEIYWFCRTCWQEMPVLSQKTCSLSSEFVEELPRRYPKAEKDSREPIHSISKSGKRAA